MVLLEKSYEAITDDQLKRYEKQWQINLPVEYRNFLLKHNDGYPQTDTFYFLTRQEGSNVDFFLGLHNDEEENLLSYLEIYTDRLPKELFPIAHESGGNLICIGIQDEQYGKVYFWDHELEKEKSDYNNVTLIADDFNLFLESLFELKLP